jgi:hypothetical protein
MARGDPPGRGPGVVIAVGVPKPDGKGGRMGPPGGGMRAEAGNTKASPIEATVIRSDEHCIDCKNYNPQDGSCEEVDGSFDPQDSCVKYFSPLDESEPDADDRAPGESGRQYSDNDADDMRPA